MPRNQGIGRTGRKHKKSAAHNIHRQPKATTEPTVATEAPEPPAEPHNESEMEVEPAAPDQTANRLLLMTAEHEAAVARRLLQQGGRCWLHQLIDDDSEVFESEAKEEMVIVAREVDDYCLMVGDTRPEGIFGSTLAAEAVVAARDFEECVRDGTIVGRGRLGDWVVPDLSEEYDDLTEAEEAEARGLAARASYRRAIHQLKAAFPELPTPDPVVRRCVCSPGAPRWPWALDINCVDWSYCRGPDECRPFSEVMFLWRSAWREAHLPPINWPRVPLPQSSAARLRPLGSRRAQAPARAEKIRGLTGISRAHFRVSA